MNLPTIGKPKLVSVNPEGAEALRNALVPSYRDCLHVSGVERYGEGVPEFAGCTESQFGKENYGECLGQCALSGTPYGGARRSCFVGLY